MGVEIRRQLVGVSHPTTSVPGISLRLSGLAARAFIHWSSTVSCHLQCTAMGILIPLTIPDCLCVPKAKTRACKMPSCLLGPHEKGRMRVQCLEQTWFLGAGSKRRASKEVGIRGSSGKNLAQMESGAGHKPCWLPKEFREGLGHEGCS